MYVYKFSKQFEAACYNSLLHCKHLQSHRLDFPERCAEIVSSFVSITLTITFPSVTSRVKTQDNSRLMQL